MLSTVKHFSSVRAVTELKSLTFLPKPGSKLSWQSTYDGAMVMALPAKDLTALISVDLLLSFKCSEIFHRKNRLHAGLKGTVLLIKLNLGMGNDHQNR